MSASSTGGGVHAILEELADCLMNDDHFPLVRDLLLPGSPQRNLKQPTEPPKAHPHGAGSGASRAAEETGDVRMGPIQRKDDLGKLAVS